MHDRESLQSNQDWRDTVNHGYDESIFLEERRRYVEESISRLHEQIEICRKEGDKEWEERWQQMERSFGETKNPPESFFFNNLVMKLFPSKRYAGPEFQRINQMHDDLDRASADLLDENEKAELLAFWNSDDKDRLKKVDEYLERIYIQMRRMGYTHRELVA